MEIYAGRKFPRARDVAMSERYVAWAAGQSAVVEDRRTGAELFRVKKLSYMYWVDIVPDESMLIVQGTVPIVYFFALPGGELIRKIRLGREGSAQDSLRAVDPAGRFMIYPLQTSDGLTRILRIDLKTLDFQTLDEISGRWRLASALPGQDGAIEIVGTGALDVAGEKRAGLERVRLVDGVPVEWQDLSSLGCFTPNPPEVCLDGKHIWCASGDKLRRAGANLEILNEIVLEEKDRPWSLRLADGLLWGTSLSGFTVHDPGSLEILFRCRCFGGVLRVRELEDGQVLISPFKGGAFIADIRF